MAKRTKERKRDRNESKYGTSVSGTRLNGPERREKRERERQESKSKREKIPFEFPSPAHLKERKVEINLTSFNTALVSQTL